MFSIYHNNDNTQIIIDLDQKNILTMLSKFICIFTYLYPEVVCLFHVKESSLVDPNLYVIEIIFLNWMLRLSLLPLS